MWAKAGKVAETLPEGNLKRLVLATGHAYHDAGVMWCGYADELTPPLVTREDVVLVIERLGMRNMTPYAMVVTTFGAAGGLKDILSAALGKSPTAQAHTEPPVERHASPPAVRMEATELTAEQMEREAQRLAQEIDNLIRNANAEAPAQPTEGGDWAFPKQGMRGSYNKYTNGVLYDVGDGIFVGHRKLNGVQGQPVMAFALFFIQVPQSTASNFDLAIIAASKTVDLAMNDPLEKMVVGWEDNYGFRNHNYYRFRTAGGKVVGVTVAGDRRVAVVRFLQDTQ